MISILIIIAANIIMKYVYLNSFVYMGLLLLSGIIVLKYAPVEDENKPLDEIEKRVYKKRAMIVWAVECIVGIGALILNISLISTCVVWAIITVCIMLLFKLYDNIVFLI